MIELLHKILRIIKSVIGRYQNRVTQEIVYKEKMKMGVLVFYITLFIFLAVAAIYLFLMLSSSGNYISSWFLWTTSAVIVLIALSAPHSIVVTDKCIEIHGIIDMTTIQLNDIEEISVLDPKSYRSYLPIIASFGFLGYFGYFMDIRNKEIVRFSLSRYKNLVAIKTKKDQIYVVNIDAVSDFIRATTK